MSIKYNEFGEVVSVNGLVTGQRIGTPMQDATPDKPEDNKAYATELNTVGRSENMVDDYQPEHSNGGSGGSGDIELAETLILSTDDWIVDSGYPYERYLNYYNSKLVSPIEYCFAYNSKFQTVDLPNLRFVSEGMFYNCGGLKGINIPNVTEIMKDGFNGCGKLESIRLPYVNVIGSYAFYSNTKLSKVDIYNDSESDYGIASITIRDGAFLGCLKLTTLIIRNSSRVATVDNISALADTPINMGEGHIYVPSSIYEGYRTAYETAFPTGAFDVIFRKIEDYPEICG